jgi:hypothetical protein
MMRPIEIESWSLRVIERVRNCQPVEDSRVELKADWPRDASKAARRLAGHANAARGEPILWLIGVDEVDGVQGASHAEPSRWWSSVKAIFDGIAPALSHLNVCPDGKTVVALCVDTSRAPYVVKNPAFGHTKGEGVALEVPWREGTSVRSATRSDLILLLSPLVEKPKLELLEGEIRLQPKDGDDKKTITITTTCSLSAQPAPIGPILLALPETAVGTWAIEASTNLVDWTAITNIALYFSDPESANFNHRFYRILQQ